VTASIVPLEARKIAQRFGRKVVLRAVDLELRAGEVVGLIGANGAGKTTLFSILTGLMQPDSGSLRLGGSFLEDLDLRARARLAYVAHGVQLYPGLSARENLELYAALRAAAGASTLASAEVLARFGLAEAAERRVSAFSRGMGQRLALARAVAGAPELLILDEPFTALDRAGRELLVEVLAEERARGAAVLLSSHDHAMLVRIADRVVSLERGVIAGEVRRDDASELGEGSFAARAAALWSGAEVIEG
jgi:heme ABC exporter ATP-binding subunit CcmA